jgi:hypothetical protein
MWLKATKGKVPAQLDRFTVTPAQARKAFGRKSRRPPRSFAGGLGGRWPSQRLSSRCGWFVGYLIAHDAHHRGQITMLARQSGFAIPQKAMFGMCE